MAMQARVCVVTMDPSEKLTVRFHFGGQFVRIGPNLDYVGGDEAMSELERDKVSLPEVKGSLGDHVTFKESMKIYFLLPGINWVTLRENANAWLSFSSRRVRRPAGEAWAMQGKSPKQTLHL